MDSLRKHGTQDPGESVGSGVEDEKREAAEGVSRTEKSSALLREQRLAAWQRFQMQKAKSESVKEMIGTLKSMNRITDDAYAAYSIVAAEMQTEKDLGADSILHIQK
jgi:hypothetical protein